MDLNCVRNIWERTLEQLFDIVGTVSGAERQIYIAEGSNLEAKSPVRLRRPVPDLSAVQSSYKPSPYQF